MIHVSIKGQIAKKSQIIDFIGDTLTFLMPRLRRNVDIDIEIVNKIADDPSHYAQCSGDKNSADITLCRYNENDVKFTLDEIMLNLAHELVHAKQFVRGELHSNLNKWKSLDYSNTAYSRQPWEKEAYLLEDELLEKYWNKNGKINNKKK